MQKDDEKIRLKIFKDSKNNILHKLQITSLHTNQKPTKSMENTRLMSIMFFIKVHNLAGSQF